MYTPGTHWSLHAHNAVFDDGSFEPRITTPLSMMNPLGHSHWSPRRLGLHNCCCLPSLCPVALSPGPWPSCPVSFVARVRNGNDYNQSQVGIDPCRKSSKDGTHLHRGRHCHAKGAVSPKAARQESNWKSQRWRPSLVEDCPLRSCFQRRQTRLNCQRRP